MAATPIKELPLIFSGTAPTAVLVSAPVSHDVKD